MSAGGDVAIVPNTVRVVEQNPLDLSNGIPITGFLRGPSTDAFGRQRVSTPVTLFDSKQLYDDELEDLLFVNYSSGPGTSSATHYPNLAATRLAVATGDATTRFRQTKRYFNYQAGKSLAIFVTFCMRARSDATKRVGYFDDDNGILLSVTDGSGMLTRRTYTGGSPNDYGVVQANWNMDPFDGSGPSGVTLDWTKTQIMVIDLEWLGVGAARCGFVIDGVLWYAHEFRNTNVLDLVYMSTPNLPVRWEIYGSGEAAADMDTICCTVISEGGDQDIGVHRSVGRVVDSPLETDETLRSVVAIRLKQAYARATVVPQGISLLNLTNADYRWALLLNPTFGEEGDAASFEAVPNSYVEFDVTRTQEITDEGIVIAQGYISNAADAGTVAVQSALTLACGRVPATDRDEMVLAVQKAESGGNENYMGAINWLERL
jgi:hypothetical protein